MSRLVRLIVLPLLLAVIALPLATHKTFADPRDFKLVNNTSQTISELYVSPSTTDDWEDDLLQGDSIRSGSSFNVTFGRFNPNTCIYDILVVTIFGDSGELDGVDLCNTNTVTFHD
jgi:hypothetical protein